MFVEAERVGFTVVFHLYHECVAGDDRGAAHAEAVGNIGVIGGETAQPLEVALEIQANDVIGGKHGVDIFAITAGCGRGHAGLGVAHGAAGGPELTVPCHAAVLGVERENVQARLGGAAAAGDDHVIPEY